MTRAVDAAVQEMEADLASLHRQPEGHAAAVGAFVPATLVPASALVRGAVAGARDVLARLRNGSPPADALPPDLAHVAQLLAGHDHVAELCLHAQEAFWRAFATAAERAVADDEIRWQATRAAAAQAGVHLRRLSRLCSLAMARERSASIEALVMRALGGEPVPPAVLRYDLDRRHVAIVSDPESAARLRRLCAHRRWQVLQVPAEDAVWTWLCSPARLAEPDVEGLTSWHRQQPAAVAAIGEPASGRAGFRTTHEQALEAWSVARSSLDGVARYGDITLMIALRRDPALAAMFLSRELGALARDRRHERELRNVLRTYLESGHNTVSASSAVGYCRRTVERKIRQAEELLGHPARHRSGELLIALRLIELTGPQAVAVCERAVAAWP
jgi:hypothetical protein